MYFYNRELDLLQPFRLRWYKNTTALISYGVAIRYICCSPRTGVVCLKGYYIYSPIYHIGIQIIAETIAA